MSGGTERRQVREEQERQLRRQMYAKTPHRFTSSRQVGRAEARAALKKRHGHFAIVKRKTRQQAMKKSSSFKRPKKPLWRP